MTLGYGYGAGASNNGNLISQTIAADGHSFSRSYSYDGFNRLAGASEGSAWSRAFGYDAYGNMWVESGSGVPVDSFTAQSASAYNAQNRRVEAGLNIGYDAAGNQTSIGAYTWAYDAENRLKTSTINSATVAYFYDGEGRRVKRVQPAGTTVYVYDAGGNLAAEYGLAEPGEQCKPCYVTGDHLGSTRMLTDAAGAVKSLHDYLPFGEEVQAGVGGRSSAYYPANPLVINDGMAQKFTGQMRDTESGLDYFNARYYGPGQGRFVSVDPGNAGADPANPQSWNGYAYVGNNPLNITDPNGESWITALFGVFGFIGGALSGGALFPWWYTAIMTGATTAGAQYSFEKAVTSRRARECSSVDRQRSRIIAGLVAGSTAVFTGVEVRDRSFLVLFGFARPERSGWN